MPVLDLTAWLSALGVFASAYLIGWSISRRLEPTRAVDLALARFTVGLAVLPLLVLLAGQIQGWLLLRPVWMGVAIAGGLRFGHDLTGGLRGWRPERPSGLNDALTRLAALPWVATTIYLLAPLSCPPLNYDVLEYHLGVVPHFFEAGRIEPIPHVFYSAQPIATEMLYTLASVLEGTAWAASTGRVQWGMVLLAGLLMWRAAERAGVPRTIALLLPFGFLTHPIMVRLELDRMTDLTGAVFLLGGWLIWLNGPDDAVDGRAAHRRSAQSVLLLGLLAGGAVSSKWTNAGTAAFGIAMAPAAGLLLSGPSDDAGQGGGSRRWFLNAGLLLGAGALVLMPWSAWVWRQTGNPIAPFGAAVFPTERWGPEHLNYLLGTHRPLAMMSGEYWERLAKRIVSPTVGLWPLFVAAALLLLQRMRARPPLGEGKESKTPGASGIRNVLISGGVSIFVGLLLWGRLRHSAERFLAPLIALEFLMLGAALASLIGRESPAWRRAAWGTLLVVILGAAATSPVPPLAGARVYLDHALGESGESEFLSAGLGATTEFFDAANALPEGSRLMAIGEARRYAFRRPVTLASVFDRHPIATFIETAPDAAALRRALRDAGYTHLAVNEYETARLLDFHPPPVLEADAAFMEVRAGRNAGELVRLYPGYSEFGARPLTREQRRIYVAFLRELKSSAQFHRGTPGGPAFWISEL